MQYDNSCTTNTPSDASALPGDRELEEQNPEFSLDPNSAYMRTEAVAVKASVLTVLLYGGCSVGMNFVNKATLNSFRWGALTPVNWHVTWHVDVFAVYSSASHQSPAGWGGIPRPPRT